MKRPTPSTQLRARIIGRRHREPGAPMLSRRRNALLSPLRTPGAAATGRKYAAALFGQGLTSAFHFGLHVMLVRILDPAAYGIFSLAFVAATLGVTITGALVILPLTVYTPGLARRAPRAALEALLSSINLLLVAGVFLISLVFALSVAGLSAATLPFAAFAACFTFRAYSRAFAFARRRPAVALAGDGALVAVSVIALGGAVLAGASEHLANVLWALAAGNLGAGWIELAMLGVGARCAHRRRSFARYREIWRHVRWAVVGAGTSILQQQAHSLLISITTGPAAYAPIAAGAILLSPVRIGIQAWHMVMRPELAVAIARGERRSVTWMLMLSMGVLTLGTLLVAAAVFFFWAPIETLLYRERYEDQPMAWIVAGWIAITLCSALSTGPSSALQAFKSFRILALATVVGSAVSLAAVGCILLVWPPAMTLAGVLLAQTFTLVFLLRVTWKRMAALHDSARGG